MENHGSRCRSLSGRNVFSTRETNRSPTRRKRCPLGRKEVTNTVRHSLPVRFPLPVSLDNFKSRTEEPSSLGMDSGVRIHPVFLPDFLLSPWLTVVRSVLLSLRDSEATSSTDCRAVWPPPPPNLSPCERRSESQYKC